MSEVLDIDHDGRTLTLEDGSEVPITELNELRPGLYGYMAGPTPAGGWIVGQYLIPEEDTRS